MQNPRESSPSLTEPFLLGAWRVHPGLNRLEPLAGGEIRRLEPKAMDVLCALAARAGHTVSRDMLLSQVWRDRVVVDGVLARVIRALRATLEDDARQPRYIETVSKRGYRLLLAPCADLTSAAQRESVHRPTPDRWPSRSARGLGLLGVVALALALLPGTAATQRVLWVDDHPDRNQKEIAVLRQMGFAVHTAVSNEQAAERLRAGRYAVLISDMFRQVEEDNAGLRLPREVTDDRNRLPPVVYYVSKVDAPRTAEGYPVTSHPRELFAMVRDLVAAR